MSARQRFLLLIFVLDGRAAGDSLMVFLFLNHLETKVTILFAPRDLSRYSNKGFSFTVITIPIEQTFLQEAQRLFPHIADARAKRKSLKGGIFEDDCLRIFVQISAFTRASTNQLL
jgi:hypothetical protein